MIDVCSIKAQHRNAVHHTISDIGCKRPNHHFDLKILQVRHCLQWTKLKKNGLFGATILVPLGSVMEVKACRAHRQRKSHDICRVYAGGILIVLLYARICG